MNDRGWNLDIWLVVLLGVVGGAPMGLVAGFAMHQGSLCGRRLNPEPRDWRISSVELEGTPLHYEVGVAGEFVFRQKPAG